MREQSLCLIRHVLLRKTYTKERMRMKRMQRYDVYEQNAKERERSTKILKQLTAEITTLKDRKPYMLTLIYNITPQTEDYMRNLSKDIHKTQAYKCFSHFFRSDFRSYLLESDTRVRRKIECAPTAYMSLEKKDFKPENQTKKLSFHSHALVLIHHSQIARIDRDADTLKLDSSKDSYYRKLKQEFVSKNLSCKFCQNLIYDIHIKPAATKEILDYITKNDVHQKRSDKVDELTFFSF